MLRIMSFNIWGDFFGNPVEEREEAIERVFRDYVPDIIGIQEATPSWTRSAMFRSLRDVYAFAEPENPPVNNSDPLLYNKERFFCVESGYVPYRDTPDASKAATWAVLEERDTARRIAVFCTHFWWMHIGEADHDDDVLRVANAALLTDRAIEITQRYGVPAVAMGDLNSPLHIPTHTYLRRAGWKYAQADAPETRMESTHHGDPVRGTDGKYHGCLPTDDYTRSLDHILYRGDLTPVRFGLVQDAYALDASDHSPLWCDFI